MSEQATVIAAPVTAEKVDVSDNGARDITAEPSKPTRDEAIAAGWSAEEADKAEKRGMLVKKEEPKAEPEKVEAKTEAEPVKAEEKQPERRRTGDHEFEMTPEQEEAFNKIFPAGTKPNSFFVGMKIERIKRQAAIREAEQLRQERETLKAKLEAFEKMGASRKSEAIVDESGNEIDPDDRPLTMKQIREMQRQQQEEQEQQRKEIENRSRIASMAHEEQEEMARQIFPDFDDAMKLAAELAKGLDTIITDPMEVKFARKLMVEFQHAVANADKIGPNDLNAAELAYKIGRLHPMYGKKSATGQKADDGTPSEKDPKNGNGGLTPEQLKRLEANTQRRASSASIPGGHGKSSVLPEEVTTDQLNRMDHEQRKRFRDKYPDHYSKLLRG